MGETSTSVGRRISGVRQRLAVAMGSWLERLLLWRVWERMLEIKFAPTAASRSRGKAFVSFFPLVIVVAAFAPERIRSSIITTVTARLGLRGDALTSVRERRPRPRTMFGRRPACSVLCSRSFSLTSFTTALQRMYLRAWRRPPRARAGPTGGAWRGC